MKRKNKIILILFVIFNLLLLFKIKIDQKENSKQKEKITEYAAELTEYVEKLKKLEINGFAFEASHIQIDSFNNLTSPVLCLYVSQLHCRPCVDSLIIQFKKFYSKNTGVNFLILANYQTSRELNLFKRINQFSNNNQVVNVKNNESPLLRTNFPVIFIYNPSSLKAELVFFPNTLDIARTQEYLGVVKSRFFP